MPQCLLATLATGLLDVGASVQVIDTGIPEFAEAPPAGEAASAPHFALAQMGADAPPSLLVIQIAQRKDVTSARMLARLVKAEYPTCVIIVAGAYAEAYGPVLVHEEPSFDAAVLFEPEAAIAEAFEQLALGHPLSGSPNMVVMRDGVPHRGRRALARQLDHTPVPNYTPGVYPSLYQGKKLHLFEIEHARGGLGNQMGPTAPWSVMPVRVKPPSLCVREIEHIRQAVPTAGAFYFSGAGVPAQCVENLCYELRGLERPVRYARDTQVPEFETVSPHSLHASGCRVLRFALHTGSQRLLEDFYGQDYTISQAERALQRAQRARLFRVADFTFPVPHDDRHTRAETLRLIARTMPEALSVSMPELRPESTWRDWQDAYGFEVAEEAYRAWVVNPDAAETPAMPYGMRDWSAAACERETAGLLSDAQDLGIYASLSPQEGLVAWLLELDQSMERFALLQHEALLHEDSAANLVRIFNERAALPASRVVWFPFHPELRAASN